MKIHTFCTKNFWKCIFLDLRKTSASSRRPVFANPHLRRDLNLRKIDQSSYCQLRKSIKKDVEIRSAALGQILEEARKIAERSLPRDGNHLRKLADDTENMAASLAEMRSNGQGTRYTLPSKRDGFCLFHNPLDYSL